MITMAEHNLQIQVKALKLQLEIANAAINCYKRMAQNQSKQIACLLDDTHFNRPVIQMSEV
jgi:hypothetical protein